MVYKISGHGDFSRDYALRDQIRRAAISVMANVAEGFSQRSNREFVQFLFTAKASAAEVQSHLYVALDQGYLGTEEFQKIYDRVDLCARQISRLITYLLHSDQPRKLKKTQRTQQTQ